MKKKAARALKNRPAIKSDKAALKIVRNSAPSDIFRRTCVRAIKMIWVVITHFSFTRDQQLETELRGGVK
jgi:hypothetical protein